MRHLDSEQWSRLSPLLDELLELDGLARADRLVQLCERHGELAESLRALLAHGAANQRDDFLEGRAIGSLDDVAGAGQKIGPYTLEHVLGSGGMGSVWLARRSDGRFEGVVAIKLPHLGLLARGGAERFAREALLLGRLAHPNIAALLDAGVTADGQPYLIIERVEGEPIDGWCNARSASIETRLRLFMDVLAAVDHAHHKLVLHRDLKPGNILVTADGRVKLLDFGIAKLLDAEVDASLATVPVFTPDYAAPEQLQGGELTTATDVYALGVLLYELLCGRHPTADPTQSRLERMRAAVETDAPRLSVTAGRVPTAFAQQRSLTPARAVRRLRGDLENIVAKALKKLPAERYATAAAMADDLRRHIDGEPVSAAPDTFGYRASKFVSRHRLSFGAASVTLLALLAGVASTTWQAIEARRERDEARYQADRALARGNLVNLMLGAMGGPDHPLTQRQILDGAAMLVDKNYSHEPGIAVELLLPIAGQYATLGDTGKDSELMARAATAAAASGDPNLVALVACDTVGTHLVAGRPDHARADLDVATQALKRSTHPRLETETACLTAEADFARSQGDPGRALERISLALDRAERAGQTGGNSYTAMLSLRALLLNETGDLPAALATQERLIGLHEAAGRTLDQLATKRNAAVVMMALGEYAAAKVVLDGVLEHWRGDAAGDPIPPYIQLTQAMLLLRFDDFRGAELVLAEMRRNAQKLGMPGFVRLSDLFQVQVAIALGRLDEADRLLPEVLASGSLTPATYRVNTPATVQATLLLAHGELAQATRVVDQELARLDPAAKADAVARAATLRFASRLALASGDTKRAEVRATEAVAAAQRLARDPTKSADFGEALLLLAQAQQALGRHLESVASATKAALSLTAGLSKGHPLTRQAIAIVGG
jgi:serine/threonine-protein kinase